MLKEYTTLAHDADSNGGLLFSVVPKYHYAYHLADHAQFVHPRKGNCMIDEDFMGVTKKVVASSVFGTKPHAVPEKVALKYRLGMHFVLEQ